MKKRFVVHMTIISTALTVLLLSGCGRGGVNGNGSEDVVFEPLSFPFKTPAAVARLAAFGIPNWSGSQPHNGIDLVANQELSSTKLISPTNGTVKAINISENTFSHPPNQLLLQIEIKVNSEWTVAMVIEPSTLDEQLKANQIAAVKVAEGQSVATGDEITDLLIGDLGYPHLHLMLERNGAVVCAYKFSSDSAKALFEAIPKVSQSDGFICYGDM